MTKTALRHALPMLISSGALFLIWMVATLPLVAVFIIDDAFVTWEYLLFLLYAAGVSCAISAGVMFPLALIGEALTSKCIHTVWMMPAFLVVVSALVFALNAAIARSALSAIFGYGGLSLLLTFLFLGYWLTLQAEHLLARVWRRLIAILTDAKDRAPVLWHQVDHHSRGR